MYFGEAESSIGMWTCERCKEGHEVGASQIIAKRRVALV